MPAHVRSIDSSVPAEPAAPEQLSPLAAPPLDPSYKQSLPRGDGVGPLRLGPSKNCPRGFKSTYLGPPPVGGLRPASCSTTTAALQARTWSSGRATPEHPSAASTAGRREVNDQSRTSIAAATQQSDLCASDATHRSRAPAARPCTGPCRCANRRCSEAASTK